MTTLSPRSRGGKVSPPITGSYRWLVPLAHGLGRLRITSQTKDGPVTTDYAVIALYDDDDGILGYRLLKTDGAESYDMEAGQKDGLPLSCECKDAGYRDRPNGGCKHRRALTAGLLALRRKG